MKDYLQKALETGDVVLDRKGRPVLIVAKVAYAEYGWLGQPLDNRQIVLQYNDNGKLGRNTDGSSRDLRKPEYKFEHWDILAEDIKFIKYIDVNTWYYEASTWCGYIYPSAFAAGTFPDCPVGTIIENPNVCPF